MTTQIIAHRGASADAPENTLPAFQLAQQQGAHMLEFDVRPTADGHIVVFHDETTLRFNGMAQPIGSLPLAEVQQLDVRGAQVPTLVELCAWACNTTLALNIEIKLPGIEAIVAEIVRAYGLDERVIVSSFFPQVLRTMRIVAPHIRRGALMGTQTLAPLVRVREAWPLPELRRLAAHAWHPSAQLPLLERLVPRVRRAGYAVHVWTVDDPAVMQRLAQLEVDGIMTNKPALLRDTLRTAA